MVFAHDIEATLSATAVLVNSVPELSDSGHDELSTSAQLQDFLREHRYTFTHSGERAELDGIRAIREPLRALWLTDSEEAQVEIVNGMLRSGNALPQLVRHGIWGWHLHATADGAALATRILMEAAMAWVEVIRTDERDRMRRCAAEDCDAVLVDFSRNRSKRYCDVGNCGNRANVAAYRARKASEEG